MNGLRLLCASVFLLPGLAAFAAGAAAEPVFPPGSRIGLDPPGDITLSKRFSGFEDPRRNVIITVLDLPEPAYQALEKSAFATGAKGGLAVEKRELFAFNDGIGFLVTGHEDAKGIRFRSWYLLVNTTNSEVGHVAALVGMRIPEAARGAYPDSVVRAALATVRFRMPPLNEMLDLLPFKVSKTAGFRLSKVAPQGALILVDGPSDDLAKHAYMVVSVGRGAPTEADARPTFARDLLTRTPLPGLVITSAEALRINAAQGYEIRANAKDRLGEPLALVQWLQFGGGNSFLRMVGVVTQDRWDEVFPRFRAVRDGIELR
jgi:hypothetical protein